jgi:hypothetical protein
MTSENTCDPKGSAIRTILRLSVAAGPLGFGDRRTDPEWIVEPSELGRFVLPQFLLGDLQGVGAQRPTLEPAAQSVLQVVGIAALEKRCHRGTSGVVSDPGLAVPPGSGVHQVDVQMARSTIKKGPAISRKSLSSRSSAGWTLVATRFSLDLVAQLPGSNRQFHEPFESPYPHAVRILLGGLFCQVQPPCHPEAWGRRSS